MINSFKRVQFAVILLCLVWSTGCKAPESGEKLTREDVQIKKAIEEAKQKLNQPTGTLATKTTAAAAKDTKQATAKAKPIEGAKKPVSTPTVTKAASPIAKPSQGAPDKFTVRFETTKGNIDIDVTKSLSPTGVDRFYELVTTGYYNDVAFFRVIPGFMAQVGLHGDPAKNAEWRSKQIKDDPVKASNTRGMVTFAKTGRPNSRTTQIFLNFKNNSNLDGMGFAPFGKIRDGSLSVLDSLHGGYGEGAPRGRGPSQARIQTEGNAYLKKDFPNLDYIKKATILK